MTRSSTKQIPTEEVKEQFLELIDQPNDDDVVVTKDGDPVTKLTNSPARFSRYVGNMKGEIKVHRDVVNVNDR